jgi:hypothetical protein
MTTDVLQDKGFRRQSDAVAIAAKIMISKIRKHIEHDNCHCCKEALALEETDK